MSGTLSLSAAKVNTDLTEFIKRKAPMIAKGKVFGWFKEQIANAAAAAGSSLDKESFLTTAKTLFDTVVKPNDGIPDFLDDVIWNLVLVPMIEKIIAGNKKPA